MGDARIYGNVHEERLMSGQIIINPKSGMVSALSVCSRHPSYLLPNKVLIDIRGWIRGKRAGKHVFVLPIN